MSLTVNFTDKSKPASTGGTIVSRAWDFGDGGTSTATNPSHTYASGGNKTVQLTVTDSNGNTDSVTHVVTVVDTAPPPPRIVIPKVASIQQRSGESYAQAAVRNLGYGYNGVVLYLTPTVTADQWAGKLTELISLKRSEPINLQLTAKTHYDAGLKAVLDALPDAWRPGFKYNYFQEPEDNLTYATARNSYKATITSAANVIRAWNQANPTKKVSLPWLEFQEWTLDPTNNASWNNPKGEALLSLFKPPPGDYDGVLWSLFEYGEHELTRIDAQIARVAAAMNHVFPTKPWALMASAYTLHPYQGPFTTDQLQAQSDWMEACFNGIRDAGASGWAWYDVQFTTGNAAGEGRLEKNSIALPILQTLGDGSDFPSGDDYPVTVGDLIFGDEFDGTAGSDPDPIWSAKTFTDRFSGIIWDGLNRIQLDGDSNLVITASKVGTQWYSGNIQTWPDTYNGSVYIETRAKVPAGYGTWASPVWTIGHGAPQLEIDICEQLGREPTSYHASARNWTSPGVSTDKSQAVNTGITLADDFHRYGAAVYADHIDFYLDGVKMCTALASDIGMADLTVPIQSLEIFMNMGGTWPGTPTVPGPVDLIVDYVRVFAIA